MDLCFRESCAWSCVLRTCCFLRTTWVCTTEQRLLTKWCCAFLQVIQPDPSAKAAYEAAFKRHVSQGKQLFEH